MEIVGILLLLVLIGGSIALHEVGHMVPAKRFGVKVTEFAVGFGPTLLRRQLGETSFRLRLLPVGGFIRMIGMYSPNRPDGRQVGGWFAGMVADARAVSAEEIGPDDAGRTFYNLSVPKRLVVMTGGPLMNLFLATLLFGICFSVIGGQVATASLGEVVACMPTLEDPNGIRANCTDRPPAFVAGLKAGDRLLAINGAKTSDWADIVTALHVLKPGDDVRLRVLHSDGSKQGYALSAGDRPYYEVDASGKKTGQVLHAAFIGIAPAFEWRTLPVTSVPPIMWQMSLDAAGALASFPEKLVGLAQQLSTGAPRDPNGPVSVVGVTRLGGDIAASDASLRSKAFSLLAMAGSLNLFLFLFNLLPLLPLDGGHAAGALFEGVRRRWAKWRGRPDPGFVDMARMLPLTYAVSVLLLGAGLLVIVADLIAPIRFG